MVRRSTSASGGSCLPVKRNSYTLLCSTTQCSSLTPGLNKKTGNLLANSHMQPGCAGTERASHFTSQGFALWEYALQMACNFTGLFKISRSNRMRIHVLALIAFGLIGLVDLLMRVSCSYWLALDPSTKESKNSMESTKESKKEVGGFTPLRGRPRTEGADGIFNGFDIYFVDHPPKSHVHCVGENFQGNRAWVFRSCEYTNLCFNVDKRQYFIYQEEEPYALLSDMWSSTQVKTENQLVSAGAQPKTWFPGISEDKYKVKTKIGSFQPNVVHTNERPKSYYRFNATIVPFYRHPRSFKNPGHLIWDDLLSIYTLLDMFGRTEDNLMLSQMKRPVTADFNEGPEPVNDIVNKFIEIFGRYDYSLKTMESFQLQRYGNRRQSSTNEPLVICADNAVIGSGTFSDHGDHHWHGQSKDDYIRPLNVGHGGLFRRYRSFLMNNMGVSPNAKIQKDPYKIIISMDSSTKNSRSDVNFEFQIKILKKAFENRAEIVVRNMATMSVKDQMELASTAAIYVTVVGGGSVTGYFLPKGASLFLLYSSPKLDWDFWNNFPDLNVHWMPLRTMDAKEDVVTLAELINKELVYLDEVLIN